jgi:sarcosine dehydrogenase
LHVAIVGGGVIGCSIAWHLVKRGVDKVSLLERDRLGSGTTWHSAGNITWKPIGDNDEQVLYMFETLEELAAAEQHTGWRRTCRLFLARKSETLSVFESQAQEAIDRGFGSELLTPAHVTAHLPLISPRSIAGAWFSPLSGRVNPNDLTVAYARAARQRGAHIIENCSVSELVFNNDRVTAIETSTGRIVIDAVVVSAGLWSRPLVRSFGVPLAQMGCEHFYVIASPEPALSRNAPSFVCPDDLIYGREEVGGMLLGCFDEHAKVIDTSELPEPFTFTLLNPDWDKFAPHYQAASEIFPALENAPIKNFTNGPESFTPDGNPLIGPLPGFAGVFVCTGMNSHGVTLSAAAGDIVADMVLGTTPRFAHARYAPDRFGDNAADESWLRARVADAPSGYYRQANVSKEIGLTES